MDSEEEYEEKHGEDIRSDNLNSEKDEGEEEQEEGDGWLVPDGYLSGEEQKAAEPGLPGRKVAVKVLPRVMKKPEVKMASGLHDFSMYEIAMLPGFGNPMTALFPPEEEKKL